MAKKTSKFATLLKTAGKKWKTAKKKVVENRGKAGFKEFDDGRYLARLENVELGESETSGRTQLVWSFKFAEGEYEDDIKKDYTGLDTDNNLFYLGRRLEQFEYEIPDDISDIEEIINDLIKAKPLCKIRLKTKGDFQNVYIDRVFAPDDEPERGGDDEDDEDEADDAEDTSEESDEEESDDESEGESDDDEESDDESDEEESDEEESDDEEESENETEDDDEEDLSVGMKVLATTKDGEKKGEVIEILESEGKARIRLDDGKVVRIGFDKLQADSTPPEEPKKKSKKKSESKPTPAKSKASSKAATKKKR